ncbi:MAG: T9SS type A sorting domain-containing protein [Bacteroidia bacterium]|nr:T9SS type A sorting domain-containing protein [Bacteroidia bacterium]
MKRLVLILFVLLFLQHLNAQVLSWSPQYPTVNDTITITYNASLGNGALNGVPVIYAHTGLITTLSTNLTDWQYKKTDWGVNTPATLLNNQGGNIHTITIPVKTYYGTGNADNITYLAFVFRDSTGSLAGKTATNSDFLIPVYKNGFDVRFTSPGHTFSLYNLNDVVSITASATTSSQMAIYHNGTQIATGTGTSLSHSLSASSYGKNWLKVVAVNGGNTVVDSIYYIVQAPNNVSNPPAGVRQGVNYLSSTSAVLMLYAPFKNFVYAIGDFSNWEMDPNFRMNQTPDGKSYWLQLNNLTPGKVYRFQYFVDQEVKVCDPYTELVLDPGNDGVINSQIYPNLTPYPWDTTSELVGILQTNQQPYSWQISIPNFYRPWKEDLVIYEMLIRDFINMHNYQTLTDTLDYLQRLGINAIELMPINEFDGNSSWGYGPALYFAPDKFYGPKNDLKAFVDACHQRGIAVIMDMVLNHAFGQNPHVRLWYDKNAKNVTAQNPFFNTAIPHPYGFDYDFDHESPDTKALVDSIFSFWMKEFHIDGFRLDLSKGLTNKWTGSDIGAWGQYDQSRIDILKRLSNEVWSRDPYVYMILEHFAEYSEEKALSDHGFMMWKNGNHAYKDALLGYGATDIEPFVSWKEAGFSSPKLVGFMESHDEQRQMYEMITYGNAGTGYDVKDLNTALDRMGMAGAFYFLVPGPKMMWEFGELGYDVDIDFPCRVCAKPIRWYYYTVPERLLLFKKWKAMIHLRTTNTAFRSWNFDMDAYGTGKRMWVSDPQMNTCVIGNWDVHSFSMSPSFQHTGTWYDFFTGQAIQVNDVNNPIFLNPGEYHIYTDVQLPLPDLTVPVGISEFVENVLDAVAYPNPFTEEITLRYHLKAFAPVKVTIHSLMGQKVRTLVDETQSSGLQVVEWDAKNDFGQLLPAAPYIYRIQIGDQVVTGKVNLLNR